MPKPRKFTGFGVVTRQGRFLWQYSRPEEQATRAAYERDNPQLAGHEDGYRVVPVSLLVDDK